MNKSVSIHISSADGGADFLSKLYKEKIGGYPKFYKMDTLARLGFVATELLLQKEQELAEEKQCERFVEREDRAIILMNRSASQVADRIFEKSLTPDNYFPSPADFVYTLPNIVTGEIALRNKYYGETTFLCVEDKAQVEEIIALAFQDEKTTSVLGGWLECSSPDDFEAELSIFTK